METEADPFVWEVSFDEDADEPQRQRIRTRIQTALQSEQTPLRLGSLLFLGSAYAVPLIFFQDQLLEIMAGPRGERVGFVLLVLFGISTLVASPLLGYLAHLRRQGQALLDAGRRFEGQVRRGADPDEVRISIGPTAGTVELVLPISEARGLGAWATVYAIPEEAGLAAVELPRDSATEMRIVQLRHLT